MKHLLLFALVFAASVSTHAAEKPNFVVIFTDDQTYRAIGYNNPAVKTPNLDKLAQAGVRLNRAYVASPICAASRASILTGTFPQQHGSVGLHHDGFKRSVIEEKRLVTLPMVLSAAGYHTAMFGKSHLGLPTTFGFAEGKEMKDEEAFAEVAEFMQREAKSSRPFLLWLTPHDPHVPLTALSTDDEEAFFDLRSDPYEMKNLIADAALGAEIERHRALPDEKNVAKQTLRAGGVSVLKMSPN